MACVPQLYSQQPKQPIPSSELQPTEATSMEEDQQQQAQQQQEQPEQQQLQQPEQQQQEDRLRVATVDSAVNELSKYIVPLLEKVGFNGINCHNHNYNYNYNHNHNHKNDLD